MANHIYVNLPVKDLKRSMRFFEQIGFSFNPQFTDDNAACLVIGENIFAMLIKESYFKTFTRKEICEATKYTEVLLAIDVDSREKVDEMVRLAVDAGAVLYDEPQDHGWMYCHSFADLDGHQWEIMYADPSQIPQQETAGQAS